jgi:hypothetical protein
MKFFDEIGFSDTDDQIGLILAVILLILNLWILITGII